ncbi:hypothetical protein G7072_16130 [Nocardioides sp. HDW12B]|uniref:hypothetical protein n=1 Tax=Nocardioides sp. HDW12B TaxID=2714939 RepID=UPI001408E68F|nr:hypothetical protein [Nocardioides sp. HDW12B]QIK67673.1 hypothetical protein G7072_16130 [Nocardioides sp. HDW12B]
MDVTTTTLHDTAGIEADELAAVRNVRRRARTAAGLTTLYAERADLDGVSPAAQFYAESVRWTA